MKLVVWLLANLYLFMFKYFEWLKVFFSLKKKSSHFTSFSCFFFHLSCWKGKVGGRKSSVRDFSVQIREKIFFLAPHCSIFKKFLSHWKLHESTWKLALWRLLKVNKQMSQAFLVSLWIVIWPQNFLSASPNFFISSESLPLMQNCQYSCFPLAEGSSSLHKTLTKDSW